MRQQAVLRRLCELGDFTRRGVQRQLAREFGVVPSVIGMDMKRLLARLDARPAQTRRVRQTVDGTGLSLADVLKTLVINAVTGVAGTA